MAEPILPYQSGVLGEGVLGSMQLGVSYTPLADLIKPYDLGEKVWVEIYTPTFIFAGVVGDYESLTWTENWYDFHSFELAINSEKINVSAFEEAGIIRFELDGVEHIGWIDDIQQVLEERGEATHTVTGRSIEAIFAQYPCMVDTDTGDGYNACGDTEITGITFTFAASTTVTASASCLSQLSAGYYLYNSTNDAATAAAKIASISTDGLTITLASAYAGTAGSGKAGSVIGQPGETAMRTYVDAECISTSDTAARLTGLTLAADSKRGSVVARTIRFDKLNEVLYGIGKETGLSFRLAHPSTGMNFTFTVLQGTDVSATVQLSVDYGNVKTLNYLRSVAEHKNLIYVGGTGDGATRIVRKVWATGTAEPSGWSRRATFSDASDCTTAAALDSKGAEILVDLEKVTTLEAEYLQTKNPTYTLGTHFKLGDIITAIYPNEVAIVARLVSISTTIERAGKTIKLTIGKKRPDFVDIYNFDKKANGAQKRR